MAQVEPEVAAMHFEELLQKYNLMGISLKSKFDRLPRPLSVL